MEAYLTLLAAQGHLYLDDPAEAFGLLYGLVVQDLQIRALLGERPRPTRPSPPGPAPPSTGSWP